jgi:hypothetical protein
MVGYRAYLCPHFPSKELIVQLLTEAQRREVQAATEEPPRFVDPDTSIEYVILPVQIYERIKPLLMDEPLSESDERQLLIDVGTRAGWDDPIMDIYNDPKANTLS